MSRVHEVAQSLARLQDIVEANLVMALRGQVDEARQRWSPYERSRSFIQTVNLGNGLDCNYDRPTIGLAYATWYMPRRIQDASRSLLHHIVQHPEPELSIVDLGCGTGATWWASHFIAEAMRATGITPPKITISACDTSPPMLDVGRRMWDHLTGRFDSAPSVKIELASWTNAAQIPLGSLVMASYLLDQSDEVRIDELGKVLRKTVELCLSRSLVIIGANNKRGMTRRGITSFRGEDNAWTPLEIPAHEPIFKGRIAALSELRRTLTFGCEGLPSDYAETKIPSWQPDSPDFHFLSREPYDTLIPVPSVVDTFVLDDAQVEAAQPDNRLTAILGAAGSGKSRVLVERLTRSVSEDVRGLRGSRYLVTAFNREVVEQLRSWFIERCSSEPRFAGGVNFSSSDRAVILCDIVTIDFLTWDTVIKRRFGLPYIAFSSDSEETIKEIVDIWARQSAENRQWLETNPWASTQFLFQELKRVIYGQGAISRDSYMNIKRRARPAFPQMNERQRRLVWSILDPEGRSPLWIDRRIAALRKVREGYEADQWDSIFLDECQDFVQADFEILDCLIKDPRRLVVCGDGTQALQTGAGYFRPKSVRGSRWKTHELLGSYRLPIRICEAIEPIARTIQRHRSQHASDPSDDSMEDIALPVSVKNAMLGCRPIILASDSVDEFSAQLAEVLQFIAPLVQRGQSFRITNADELNKKVSQAVTRAIRLSGTAFELENNSMLRIKGLERSCIFFSTYFTGNGSPGTSTDEWIYTILSRTTSVLIILLSSTTPSEVKSLIGRLRADRLLFWDRKAEMVFSEFAAFAKREPNASDEIPL